MQNIFTLIGNKKDENIQNIFTPTAKKMEKSKYIVFSWIF